MISYIPIAYNPIYKLSLPKWHRFPMDKYELLPLQLVHQGISKKSDFFLPKELSFEKVLEVHSSNYVEKLKKLNLTKSEIRKIGFPLSKKLIQRELVIANGTIKGCEKALKTGISMNIAGGTHHAFKDHGEAFCLLNDQAIAAKHLIKNKKINKLLIVDLDVHQGNGTASIFSSEKKVFTFSMHGANNYPFKKEKSDLDIELPDKTSDSEYLELLKKTLPEILKKVKPEFIFYLSGVDVLNTDKLGRLSLSINGCKERDIIVLSLCKKEQIPVQCTMGGGYSDCMSIILDAHANTFKVAKEVYT